MPDILWTGDASFFKKLLMNINNILAWAAGNLRDTEDIKERVMRSFDGDLTTVVKGYDEYGRRHYEKIADELLRDLDISGKCVLDIGCGTGISTLKLLDKGARKVCATDISEYMLNALKKKIETSARHIDRLELKVADAEALPFEDNVFDSAVSSMVLGMVPDPEKMISEMKRVVKAGGTIALSVHGPRHYAELPDAVLAVVPKRFALARRFFYWPRGPEKVHEYLASSGLTDIKIERSTWHDTYGNSREMYEFITSSTGEFYASFLPDECLDTFRDDIRRYLEDRRIHRITLDVVYAFGRKSVRCSRL
jgi:ubiquinone/menaquinone biosynthesis C-methylase UbiE